MPSKAANTPLIDPAAGTWRTADTPQLLRGIYVELRVLNLLIAAGLNQETLLGHIRKDASSVYPDATDRS